MSRTAEYFDLNVPAPKRLDKMRHDVLEHAKRYPNCPQYLVPMSWRDIRGTTHDAWEGYVGNLCQGRNGDKSIWYTTSGPFFDRECFVDELRNECGYVSIDHQGWFADEGCSRTIRGLIVRLSHGRYMAGTYSNDNDERVYYPQVFDCEQAAACAADEYARVAATEEREWDAHQIEALACQDEHEQTLARLRECLALRNNPCFTHLRDEVQDLVETLRDTREKLKTEYADAL